jgi:hypothetical protein
MKSSLYDLTVDTRDYFWDHMTKNIRTIIWETIDRTIWLETGPSIGNSVSAVVGRSLRRPIRNHLRQL